MKKLIFSSVALVSAISLLLTGCATITPIYSDFKNGRLTVNGKGALESLDYRTNGKISEIIVKDGITELGYRAFAEFDDLEEVTLPDELTSIGDYAFYDCSGLTDIEIPDSVTYIGDCAFYGCKSLAEINIPDSVEVIESDAFNYCESLTVINIPSSVESIGDYAFYSCENLERVIISNHHSGIEIGTDAFPPYCQVLFTGKFS